MQIQTQKPHNSNHMKPTVVINVVGLSQSIFEQMPSLKAFAEKGGLQKIKPVFPALTCSAQSTYLTGMLPSQHGIVGNGWYFKDQAQVLLWRQANCLVEGEKLWDTARNINKNFTCANLFWWYNMYSSVDYAITPRPVYRSDGLKLPDIYSEPLELRDKLQKRLGTFPLFNFWGPASGITSSQWIARASQIVYEKHWPTMMLIYLPHLDYCLQKEGPDGPNIPKEVKALDTVCSELITFFKFHEAQIVFLSEYGIQKVDQAIPINRILREKGWLSVREECGEDHFDAGASQAFAVADHQISHIYVKNTKTKKEVLKTLLETPGIEKVLDQKDQIQYGIQHPRSGELIAIADHHHWFSYKYWLDDRKAPDYARTVDIHKKPGYDPVELFLNPKIRFPKLYLGTKLLGKKLGLRTLMDVIPLDDTLVRGSHGRSEVPETEWPMFLSERSDLFPTTNRALAPTEIKNLLLSHVFE
jgi:predicted AlkP superfamily pyrophosphatase or phosphodiesterase